MIDRQTYWEGENLVFRTRVGIVFCYSTKFRTCLLLAFHYVIFCSVALASESLKSPLARFRAEALRAWTVDETADALPGTIRISTRIVTFSAGRVTQTEEKSALLRRKQGCFLFEPEQSRDGVRTILGRNPNYSYSVIKEDEKKDCTLGELRLKGQKGFGKLPLDLWQYLKPNSYSFIPTLDTLSKTVSSPTFKAKHAEVVDKLTRVSFDAAVHIPKQEVKVTGWMDFDPNNAWSLQRCQFETTQGATFKLVKLFSSSQRDGYRPCVSWESIQGSTEEKDWEMKQQTQFEILDTSSPADELFTLSHYGLPEPMGVPAPPSSRAWIWLLIAAVTTAALALVFAWLRRRRAMTPRLKTSTPSMRSVS